MIQLLKLEQNMPELAMSLYLQFLHAGGAIAIKLKIKMNKLKLI